MENNNKTKVDNTVVEFKNLTKRFGDFTAVYNVNLQIYRGEILGFLGPNGAGKSTTMKMMARLLKPTEGNVYICNNGTMEVLNDKSKDYLLDKIGFLIENPAFYEKMTPRDILTYFGGLKGYPDDKIDKRVEKVVEMVGMSEWIDKKLGTFSKGMRQKIGIVSAIVHDPDIVVLDEPHSGLDPTARIEVRDFIIKLREMGKTIFLSSHLLYEVSEVADRVAIISHGRVMAIDTLENLELQAQRSMINLNLYHTNGNIQKMQNKIAQVVSPLTGMPAGKNYIGYNMDKQNFEILFNGDPKNQLKIIRALFENDIDVIEYSV